MKRKAEVLASMAYTRDKIGQIEKTVEVGFSKVPERKYEYDAANRLTASNGTLFSYDSANNVTKISPVTYTYDKASQIATASNAAFEFNKVGQRIKETPTGGSATTYSYDQAGNLVTSKSPEVENTFKYDGTGLRSTETRGASTYPMVWDSTAGLPLLIRAGQDYFVYGPDGLPFEQITAGVSTYLHHDQLGSTRVLTNSKGEASGTYRYGPNGAFWEHTGTAGTLMGFAGQYRMHTGNQLIYLRARTYDPVTAQFLTPDPLVGLSGETYAYAAANPVNITDATGLYADGCGCPVPPCPNNPIQPEPTDHTATPPVKNPLEERWTIGPAPPEPSTAQKIQKALHEGSGYALILMATLESGGTAPFLGPMEESGSAAITRILAGLARGRSPGVYLVDSDAQLQVIFDELSTKGSTMIRWQNYDGVAVELSDGAQVGLRNFSRSGGRTIDLVRGSVRNRIHIGP